MTTIDPALCASTWRPPLEVASKIVIRRDRGRVYVVLKFEGQVRVVHITSGVPFLVRAQLDDACMGLMASFDWAPSLLDLAAQAFEAGVEKIGGSNGR